MAADKHVTEDGKVYRFYWLSEKGKRHYYPQLFVSPKGARLAARYRGWEDIFIEVADNWKPVNKK